MPLSDEEKAQLEALTKKSKESSAPAPNVNYNLDLSNDTAWGRAQELGIVPKPEAPPAEGTEEEEAGDPPRRRGGGGSYFGN